MRTATLYHVHLAICLGLPPVQLQHVMHIASVAGHISTLSSTGLHDLMLGRGYKVPGDCGERS